ncbi:hypothetical protein [Terrimonas sp.]|uniref:hypothetical protein n=1 Tax=Terrimonas sp. TaxID=1914338 RepID=UPI001403E44D|nr:hypothetical protein [Terrimonas sp.]
MNPIDKQKELHNKIFLGLRKSFQQLIEFKKQRKSELVILKDNKIVKVKPEQFDSLSH